MHLKTAYETGIARARSVFKLAGQEIRLQIPRRAYHNRDGAFRSEANKNTKKADQNMAPEPQPGMEPGAELFGDAVKQLPLPANVSGEDAKRDPLDRESLWGSPSNLSSGEAAGGSSSMGQNTSIGAV